MKAGKMIGQTGTRMISEALKCNSTLTTLELSRDEKWTVRWVEVFKEYIQGMQLETREQECWVRHWNATVHWQRWIWAGWNETADIKDGTKGNEQRTTLEIKEQRW